MSPPTFVAAPAATAAALVPVEPDDVALLLEAGYLYLEMGKHREAEEVFTGVAALVPRSEVPPMALGHLYFSMGRFTPAHKSHLRAIELNPQSAAAQAACGETLFFMHRPEEALACLQKALALEPVGSAGDFARALQEAHALGVFA